MLAVAVAVRLQLLTQEELVVMVAVVMVAGHRQAL
jgi:hypothetical protein